FVVVDAGMNDLLRPALYQAHHALEPVARPRRGAEVVDVVGPVCESADVLARRRRLPPLQAGDLVVLRTAGAYGMAMASQYIVRACVEEARGRVPVIAGCGTNDTRKTIENVQRAREAGADAALVVTPYYNKPTPEGLFRHFEAVARQGGLPVILYNVPSRTSLDMLPDTVARCAKVPGIVGIKEASGN